MDTIYISIYGEEDNTCEFLSFTFPKHSNINSCGNPIISPNFREMEWLVMTNIMSKPSIQEVIRIVKLWIFWVLKQAKPT